jgi:hypothetical protein
MDKQKQYMISIIILMLITGIVVYYLYFRIEKFTEPQTTVATTTTSEATRPQIINSIVSKLTGVGFNLIKTSSTTTPQNYLIEHIPITPTGTLGGVYAIYDGMLTIKVRNENDFTQLWNLNPVTVSGESYFLVNPVNDKTKALMYANGNLYLRPILNNSSNQSLHWITSSDVVKRGVAVLNSAPASMFSTEFAPNANADYSTANKQQVEDVLNAVKLGVQEYLTQISKSQPYGQLTSSSLGTKSSPLSIKLNLGGTSTFKNIDRFADEGSDIIALLDRYDGNKMFYDKTDVENAISSSGGCKIVDLSDYTSNRIGECNCKV